MEDQVAYLGNQLRRGTTKEYTRSLHIARRTAELLRICISTSKAHNAKEIIKEVKQVEQEIMQEQPLAFSVGNIVRRVIKFVRDEEQQERQLALEKDNNQDNTNNSRHKEEEEEEEEQRQQEKQGLAANKKLVQLRQSLALGQAMKRAPSLKSLFDQREIEEAVREHHEQGQQQQPQPQQQQQPKKAGKQQKSWRRKFLVIESINDLLEDLGESEQLIADQSLEHVHAKEVILTCGYSHSVECFLTTCCMRQKRSFSVIVAEGAPKYGGHKMATVLASLDTKRQSNSTQSSYLAMGQGGGVSGHGKVTVTLAPDACVFALMSRVNKVILGAHALLANGGIIAPVGTHATCIAARTHAVPVVVVLGIHKLVPQLPRDPKLDMPFRCYSHRTPGEIIDMDKVVGQQFVSAAYRRKGQEEEAAARDSDSVSSPRGSSDGGEGENPSSPGEEDAEQGEGAAEGSRDEEEGSGEGNPRGNAESFEMAALNPAYDYIPPDMISLFVTDTGCHSPSYVYRLISDYFDSEDVLLA
ncbi:subunit beta of translation initiation factor eIF-2B [Chloropicon primus]|uniref:Translation initiation factor eIF2B subunit beta n=1 Tax=Chloropicon primus TaxID=1764295 RepID=A0A5B8MXM5_9CHLO|nr:subunit beta of translation initiation factor eIF-2B [Chloropicon primus]UPR04310.1 subunit beta of translation initiation factor eIF-2B [Chloropicon primus]|eukprot:QDZ25101.1 subunit beta of translation initiation factor eIF-2B [Chloropicon primus]